MDDREGHRSTFNWWFESQPWNRSKVTGVTGLKGSSKAYLISLWHEYFRLPVLAVVSRLSEAESLVEDLQFFQGREEQTPLLFPAWETLPYDDIPPHPEIMKDRVICLFSLMQEQPAIVVAPVAALMQKVLPPSSLRQNILTVAIREEIERERLVEFLERTGYTPVKHVEERGDFSLRGGIVDIFSPLYEDPLRIEFEGDRIYSIRSFDLETQRSYPDGNLDRIVLLPAKDISNGPSRQSLVSLFDYLPTRAVVFICSWDEMVKERDSYSLSVEEHYRKALLKKGMVPPPSASYLTAEEFQQGINRFRGIVLEEDPIVPSHCRDVVHFEMGDSKDLQREIKAVLSVPAGDSEESPFSILGNEFRRLIENRMRIILVSHALVQAERLRDLLYASSGLECRIVTDRRFNELIKEGWNGITLLVGYLSAGFKNPGEKWVVVTEEEIFGERRRIRGKKRKRAQALTSYRDLREDDYVVHVDYGVGCYRGLKHLNIWGVSNDFLVLEYLDGDRLYVPVDRLNLIQRYIGGDGKPPKLDKLGGRSWERTKRKAKAAVKEMLKELIDLYATRRAFKGFSFPPVDQLYREFEATFQYEETPDQAKAIQDVLNDMDKPEPMDRLICGDVGYGKTEVAIRAAFRAVMAGKQVAVLVPTTVLAQQHLETFRERFRPYPIEVEMLSRFRTPREQKGILARLAEGKVDIVIGTHRLLQDDVRFHDLGLVVIDEEHRFGVLQKEKLKQMRKLVDVITLSATPIPRTLQMSLSGLRDLSLIQTPPEDRLAVRTFVVRYDDDVIREAILRELRRGGQVFFVHHRVDNIEAMALHLKQLVPEVSLAIAHGQMPERDLERVMLAFVKRQYNLLVCTSIIESGLDIPTANTILINHAEHFGLADLYQLRGRVGRGKHQAYAYLIIPGELSLTEEAMRRLRAIQELSELGSGFHLAIQDLEIRGAGNLFGASQSGHISAVGFELYTQLLEAAAKELKGEEVEEKITPEIQLSVPAYIPEDYVSDTAERLKLYRRLSLTNSEDEVDDIGKELADRFGKLPEEVKHLLEVIKLKIILTRLSIKKIEGTTSQFILTFHESTKVSPERVIALVERGKGRYRLTPDSRLIFEGGAEIKNDPFGTARRLLQALS